MNASETIRKGTSIIKMLLHPKYWVSNPPKTGPIDKPRYVDVILMPIAFPLSPVLYTADKRAMLVPNSMAPAKPCTTLRKISEAIFHEKIITHVEMVYRSKPEE